MIVFGSHNQNQQGHHSQVISFNLFYLEAKLMIQNPSFHNHTGGILGLWAPLGVQGYHSGPSGDFN